MRNIYVTVSFLMSMLLFSCTSTTKTQNQVQEKSALLSASVQQEKADFSCLTSHLYSYRD